MFGPDAPKVHTPWVGGCRSGSEARAVKSQAGSQAGRWQGPQDTSPVTMPPPVPLEQAVIVFDGVRLAPASWEQTETRVAAAPDIFEECLGERFVASGVAAAAQADQEWHIDPCGIGRDKKYCAAWGGLTSCGVRCAEACFGWGTRGRRISRRRRICCLANESL